MRRSGNQDIFYAARCDVSHRGWLRWMLVTKFGWEDISHTMYATATTSHVRDPATHNATISNKNPVRPARETSRPTHPSFAPAIRASPRPRDPRGTNGNPQQPHRTPHHGAPIVGLADVEVRLSQSSIMSSCCPDVGAHHQAVNM